jgi:hypothetical protein
VDLAVCVTLGVGVDENDGVCLEDVRRLESGGGARTDLRTTTPPANTTTMLRTATYSRLCEGRSRRDAR